jgi:hypothetical protein
MNQTFPATPDCRPMTGRAAAGAGGGQLFPETLVSRIPIPVEIIGSLPWIGGPLPVSGRDDPLKGRSR